MKNISLERGCVKKLFFKLAVPSVIGLLVVSMQIMVDGVFIANSVGAGGLAAVNLSMPVISAIMSVGMMVSIGGGIISSIHLGKGEKNKSGEVAAFTLLSLVLILGLISIIGLISINHLIIFLGAEQNLIPMVKSYLLPMLLLSVVYNLPVYTETFVRIGGKPNYLFLSGFTCFTANIFLDYLLIVRLKTGLSGAAYATCSANLLGSLALIGLLFKERSEIQLLKPKGDLKLLKNILYNGSSEMLTVVAASVSTFLFNRIIMASIGELGISALTIVFYVNGIVNISLYGLSQALQPIVAYNLGAGNIKKIYDVLKVSFLTGGLIGALSFLGITSCSAPLVNLFAKNDAALRSMANEAVFYFAFAYIFSFVNIICSSFHTAIEKPFESAAIAFMRSLALIAVFLLILPIIFGDKGIWMATPLAELSCFMISLSLLNKSLKKMNSDLIRAQLKLNQVN